MLKRFLFKQVAKVYLAKRGKISDTDLRDQTLAMIQKMKDRVEISSSAQLETIHTKDKWTDAEIIFHATNSAKNILRNCDNLRAGNKNTDLGKESMGKTRTLSREDLLGFVAKVQDLAGQFDFSLKGIDPKATWAHALFGQRNARGWLIINLIHLERHNKQLIRA